MHTAIQPIILLSDLAEMQDRINYKYRLMLLHPGTLTGDIKTVFERIVEESRTFRDEIVSHWHELKSIPAVYANESQIPAVVASGKRKRILAHCARDIKEVLDLYEEILESENPGAGWSTIISSQYTSMIALYNHIRQLHDAQ